MPSVASTCGSSFEPRLDRESIERRRPSEQSSAASAHPTSTEKSEGVRRGPKPKPIVEYPEPHFANWSEPPTFKASLLCKMRCLHSSRFCTDDAAVIDGHRLQLVSRRPGLCPSPVELMNTSRRAGPRRSATLVLRRHWTFAISKRTKSRWHLRPRATFTGPPVAALIAAKNKRSLIGSKTCAPMKAKSGRGHLIKANPLSRLSRAFRLILM